MVNSGSVSLVIEHFHTDGLEFAILTWCNA